MNDSHPSPTLRPAILLFGSGAVGSTYAFLLTRGGCDVAIVARSNYEAILNDGIHLESEAWGSHDFRPKHVARDVTSAIEQLRTAQDDGHDTGGGTKHDFDFIVITSKATLPTAAQAIAPAVRPDTVIVLCQNGIEIERDYAVAYPHNTIISCVVYLPVTQTSPGHIRHSWQELLEMGTFPASQATQSELNGGSKTYLSQVEELAALFRSGGATVNVLADVQEARWRKLLINAAWNPVCALAFLDDASFLRSSSQAEHLIRAIMREVAGIAQALGYHSINDNVIETQLERALARRDNGGKGIEPSMLADVKGGRTIELDAIVGNTVKLAKRVGVDCRALEVVYTLLMGKDASMREQNGVR